MKQYAATELKPSDLEPRLTIDAEIPLENHLGII